MITRGKRLRTMNRKLSLQIIIYIILVCFCLGGCEKEIFSGDDLEAAKLAYADRNLTLAERLLGRYLREERNPDKRWDAWNLLLNTVNANNQEAHVSLEFLEAMLDEYENNEERMAIILSQMGRYNEMLRHYDRAANAWSAYVELGIIDNASRVDGFRRLAAMQFGQRHFEAGEDTLQQCLALPVPDHDKVTCMLDLAEENMARERWQEVADLCQQIFDSDPDAKVFGIAGYLRGDALEQMGHEKEALDQFEKARDSYPNPAVMDNRIQHLRKNLNSKKD